MFLEKAKGISLYEDDGSEITKYKQINSSGLVEIEYIHYGITFDEDEEQEDYSLTIQGYIVLNFNLNGDLVPICLVTSVNGDLDPKY